MICQQELQSMFLLHTSCSKVWCNNWHPFLLFHAWQPQERCTHGTLPPQHSPPAQNKATAVHGWGHKHTETSPNRTNRARVGTAVQRGLLFSGQCESKQSSQLLPEASSRPQLLPRMYPGCWISNAAWAQTRHWCLFYIFLFSACWSHTWHSGNQLGISYWLQLDLNCAPAEWYCGDSLWKSNDRIAFRWDAETSRITWKNKLGVCRELKLCVCLWGLTHCVSDVLQQPGCKTPHIFKQSRKIYLLNNCCHPRISLVRVNTSLLAGSRQTNWCAMKTEVACTRQGYCVVSPDRYNFCSLT